MKVGDRILFRVESEPHQVLEGTVEEFSPSQRFVRMSAGYSFKWFQSNRLQVLETLPVEARPESSYRRVLPDELPAVMASLGAVAGGLKPNPVTSPYPDTMDGGGARPTAEERPARRSSPDRPSPTSETALPFLSANTRVETTELPPEAAPTLPDSTNS